MLPWYPHRNTRSLIRSLTQTPEPLSAAARYDGGGPIPARENAVLCGRVSGVRKSSVKSQMAGVQLWGQMVFVTTLQLCHYSMKVAMDDKDTGERVQPHSDKTLFTKAAGGLDLVRGPVGQPRLKPTNGASLLTTLHPVTSPAPGYLLKLHYECVLPAVWGPNVAQDTSVNFLKAR